VLLKIVYLLMRWLFNLAILVIGGDRAKNAEFLALRHENAVLRRTAGLSLPKTSFSLVKRRLGTRG